MSDDAMDEFRNYVVLCGKSHISINDIHRFTIEEAEMVRSNLEKKLKAKLESLPESEEKEIAVIEWKLATLEVKEINLN
jgi:hypothetical protein